MTRDPAQDGTPAVGGEKAGGQPDPRLAPTVAQVVLPLPVDRIFSYVVPEPLAGRVGPGQRVRVPFRGRVRAGVVVELGGAAPAPLQSIEALLDPAPALTAPLLALTRWAAEQTVSAWGEVVARTLPPPARMPAPTAVRAPPPPSAPGPVLLVYGADRDRIVETAAVRARESGRGVLLLAPEIEIAQTWAARLERQFGGPVPLVTSAQRPRRRWEAWWALREGVARHAVGTRVAACLPVTPLGLVIVIDEHDPAHKAPDAPRWHVRDVALRRAHLEGAGCVMTSGAPSLESWARVRVGGATAEEAKGGQWPAIHRVDLRTTSGTACLSPGLCEAVRDALATGGSALLLLNRLGYGRALGCLECGAVRRCPACRVALTYHLRSRSLVCRLCGRRHAAPSLCGHCRGRRLAPLGWGTERLEAEAIRAFPGVGVARYDSEMSPARAVAVREAFRASRVRVVVGTQMALRLCTEAPVRVAAIVLADATLSLPDFRAGERTFQLAWHLAESVAPGGSLWLQSFFPDHPALEAVALGARELFYEREWAERQELGYPPAGRIARIVVEGRDASGVVTKLAERCRAADLSVLGPVALPGTRVQLVLQGGDALPPALRSVLEPFRGHRRRGSVRILADVDPVDLL